MPIQHIAMILTMGSLLAVSIRCLYVLKKSKSFGQLILASWVYCFIWIILCCFVFPFSLMKLGYSQTEALKHFPEGPAIVATFFTGWMLGVYLSAIILLYRLFRYLFLRIFKRDKTLNQSILPI